MKKLTLALLSIALLALITLGAKTCTKIPQTPTVSTKQESPTPQVATITQLRNALLDPRGNPTKQLLDLLAFLHIQHDGTLESIVQATQKEWLRQAGKERWQVEEKYAELHEQLMPYLEKVITLQEIKPLQKQYDYAVILGATVSRIRMRLAYLADLWHSGLRVNNIVFLTGQRPLDPEQEKPENLLNANNGILPFKKDWQAPKQLPTMETDMAKLVYDQANLPENLRVIPVEFIDAPAQKTQPGAMRRPNTLDTINSWLKTNPKPGFCLCVSTQPHIGYQDAVMRTYMPAAFQLETVGPAAWSSVHNVIILDALARWLYQEQHNRQK